MIPRQSEMMYENPIQHISSILVDILIFWIKSIYFIAESIMLTLIPDRYRKLKVIQSHIHQTFNN